MLKYILGIFEFAPDEMNLTGNYVCGFSEKPDFTGNYEKGYLNDAINTQKFWWRINCFESININDDKFNYTNFFPK